MGTQAVCQQPSSQPGLRLLRRAARTRHEQCRYTEELRGRSELPLPVCGHEEWGHMCTAANSSPFAAERPGTSQGRWLLLLLFGALKAY
eukprot:COSAG01_NODE_352_length_18424_cov_29.195034_4_plen_89_part_00